MHLAFHGGMCCGIKTIYNMGINPEDEVGPLPALEHLQNQDCHGYCTKVQDRFFHEAAPQETCLARLDRYIKYITKRRPKHIVEITLAEGTFWSQAKWWPVLESRGFKLVNECPNSNSGNVVKVFHLNIGE